MIRATPALSLLAAALVALTPVHAFAQGAGDNARVNVRERPRPEYDPLGLRFGGFRADASLSLAAESTDNLLAAEDGGTVIDDVVYRVAPNVRLASTWSRHAVSVAAGGVSATHQDTESEDYETYFVAGNGRLDLGSRTQITADARVSHGVEPRTEADNVSTGDPIEFDEERVSLSISHAFNRVRLIGRVSEYSQEFDAINNSRDLDETLYSARVELAISPRLSLVGQVTEDERDYDNLPGLSSSGETYLLGLGLNVSNLLRGELTAGQFTRDYDDPATGSIEGTAVNANLEWYVTGITTLSGFAGRNAEESGANATSAYVAERAGVRVDHELLRNLILSAAYSTGKRDYETGGLQDETEDMLLEGQYLLNRRVALQVRALREEVTSTDPTREFEDTRFLAGITLRL